MSNSNSPVQVGIDDRGRYYYVARVRHETGRTMVEALARFDRTLIRNHQLLDTDNIVMAVADDQIRTNEFTVYEKESPSPEEQIRFEQMQLQLEEPEHFYFDTLPVRQEPVRYLSMAVRRSRLSDQLIPFASTPAGNQSKVRFTHRAVALGRGFLHYGRTEGTDFVCLADINDRLISICFVHRGDVAGLTMLRTEQFDLGTPSGFERMTTELKTVVNFKLADLSRNRISIPLSALLISGRRLDETSLSVLTNYFAVPVREVELNPSFFPKPENVSDIPAGNYLVALGLTVPKKTG